MIPSIRMDTPLQRKASPIHCTREAQVTTSAGRSRPTGEAPLAVGRTDRRERGNRDPQKTAHHPRTPPGQVAGQILPGCPDRPACLRRRPSPRRAGSADEAAGKRPLILAHAMPWFVAKPFSPQWGWHWAMNAVDPETIKRAGGPSPPTTTRSSGRTTPPIPRSPSTICCSMKLAGIDGLIVDWYGLADQYDYPVMHRNTAALFPAAAKAGLKLAICYEDQTIPQLVAAGKVAAGERVSHARQELDWLRTHWFADPAYLKLGGKPVLLSFGRDGLTDAEWAQVLAPEGGATLSFSEHERRSAAAGAFDWPVPGQGAAALDRFYDRRKEWRTVDPRRLSPVPRHLRRGEGPAHPTAGSTTLPARRSRTRSGADFSSGAPAVQIATWNDWGEGPWSSPPWSSATATWRPSSASAARRSTHPSPSSPTTSAWPTGSSSFGASRRRHPA